MPTYYNMLMHIWHTQQVNLSLVHKPDRTSDEYVQKKLKKYEFMFVQVAYRAESNKLTEMFPSMVQREDRDRDATATANIHRLVEHWVQNGIRKRKSGMSPRARTLPCFPSGCQSRASSKRTIVCGQLYQPACLLLSHYYITIYFVSQLYSLSDI